MAPELFQARLRAKRITKKYDSYLPDEATSDSLRSGRKEILLDLIGNLGACWIESPLHVDYGCNISIGDMTFLNTK
jgi:hypothetical protein